MRIYSPLYAHPTHISSLQIRSCNWRKKPLSREENRNQQFIFFEKTDLADFEIEEITTRTLITKAYVVSFKKYFVVTRHKNVKYGF
jgi:hypothetical protein